MVEYSLNLDSVFHSLSDPIRRDILKTVSNREMSVGELVGRYNVSFAAVSKHLKVLERSNLIRKQKKGRKQIVTIAPGALHDADTYLEQYRQLWQSRFDKLNKVIQEGEY